VAIKSEISEVTDKTPLILPRVDIGLCAFKIESQEQDDIVFAFGGKS
jgi:hypothetical protein